MSDRFALDRKTFDKRKLLQILMPKFTGDDVVHHLCSMVCTILMCTWICMSLFYKNKKAKHKKILIMHGIKPLPWSISLSVTLAVMENCSNYMLLVTTFFCYCNSVAQNKALKRKKKNSLRATLIQAIPLYMYVLLHNWLNTNDQFMHWCHSIAVSFFFLDILGEEALKLNAC